MVLFYELANHYDFKYQAQKLCDSFMCTFSVNSLVCTADFCKYAWYVYETRVWNLMLFTVFKILFYEILIMLGIQVYNKNIFFSQGYDTNLEFNTCPFID